MLSMALALVLAPESIPYRWRNVEVVGGGFVTGVISHPRERDLLYARTDIGGAYRWKAAPGKRHPTVFLTGRVGGQIGVFRSTDEGRTWLRINDQSTGFGTMSHLTGDPRVFGRIYLGTNGRGILVADPK